MCLGCSGVLTLGDMGFFMCLGCSGVLTLGDMGFFMCLGCSGVLTLGYMGVLVTVPPRSRCSHISSLEYLCLKKHTH
jgi:hypothetical protein